MQFTLSFAYYTANHKRSLHKALHTFMFLNHIVQYQCDWKMNILIKRTVHKPASIINSHYTSSTALLLPSFGMLPLSLHFLVAEMNYTHFTDNVMCQSFYKSHQTTLLGCCTLPFLALTAQTHVSMHVYLKRVCMCLCFVCQTLTWHNKPIRL